MEQLIKRILDDAEAEKRALLNAARKNAKGNIEYAKTAAEKVVLEARAHVKALKSKEAEVGESERLIKENIKSLRARTRIVDKVFEDALDKIKFKWRVEKHNGYELHLTREVLGAKLRENLEVAVVEKLFG